WAVEQPLAADELHGLRRGDETPPHMTCREPVRHGTSQRTTPLCVPLLLGAVFGSFLGAAASAQLLEVGHPLVRCIAPTEYDGGLQIFSTAQTPDGQLYFACPEDFAVLRYDGERWRKFVLPVPPVSL